MERPWTNLRKFELPWIVFPWTAGMELGRFASDIIGGVGGDGEREPPPHALLRTMSLRYSSKVQLINEIRRGLGIRI